MTAMAMYNRDSIGSAHWSRLIEVTTARGEILTAEMLIRFRDLNVAKTRGRTTAHTRGRTRPKSQSLPPIP
ncbi:MAG TPA: hypothetical protein VLN57_13470 [Xanthobacteraceae bacterium]|nr:hypothetical protein [Xanthobacteraceae bacterium]